MEFPIINQQDPKWASNELGVGEGYTIGKFGCALSCLTSLCRWYGRSTTPDLLNLALVNVNGFQSNGTTTPSGQQNKTLLVWGMLAAVFGEIRLERNIAYPTTPADMSIVDAYLSHNMPVIVGVSFTHDPKQTVPSHYVVIYKKNNDGTYQCMDPWFGDEVVFDTRYGVNGMSVANAILQVVCYSGPAPQEPATEAPITAHPQQAVTADDTLKKQVTDNWNLYLQEVDLVKQKDDRIQALESQVSSLQSANSKLTTEIATTKLLNANLANHLSNLEKTDSAALEEANKTIEQLQQDHEIVQTVSGVLKTKPTLKGLLSELDTMFTKINWAKRITEVKTPPLTPPAQTATATNTIYSLFGLEVS